MCNCYVNQLSLPTVSSSHKCWSQSGAVRFHSHTVIGLDRRVADCSQLVHRNTWLDIWQNLERRDLLIQQRGYGVLTKHKVQGAPCQLVPRQILSESRHRAGRLRTPGVCTYACIKIHTLTHILYGVIGSDTFSLTQSYS